ncbi:SDR family NAD(P)-dependent oxidoreductase [Rhodohalobacter sp. SW132]|uniref:SDR family oxidoreductase n=1 Tax=Rhodohalobacter sp. SW132 TaxID=2293433 RepID=UPI000E285904|nr:SDR family oxidoreductase [Rhodohalobacter sp. SW132]REL39048.1 SDR family NAD(P)-dependent oxidoreductase [Rhodohalobacter sp. SW132]
MSYKIAAVTGANSGIGKITSQALLNEGYRVVMICRNLDKAETARKEIIEKTGNDRADILICDLSEMSQIRETAAKIRQRYDRLDRLVNNAGFLPDDKRKESPDGIELTVAVNHLGYFLLTRELMPLLEKTPQSRIMNVASEAHRYGEFDPKNIQLTERYSASKAYGNSKLFNIMFTHHLNKKLEGKDITTYSLHPGVVNTNFAAESDSWFAKLFNLGRFFMKSPEQGAQTTIYLCTEPGIENLSGRYFNNSKPAKPQKDVALDDEACKRLWKMSEEMVG